MIVIWNLPPLGALTHNLLWCMLPVSKCACTTELMCMNKLLALHSLLFELIQKWNTCLPKPRLKKDELYDSLLFLIPSLWKRKTRRLALPEAPQALNDWHFIIVFCLVCPPTHLWITCTYDYWVILHEYLLNSNVIFYSHYSNFVAQLFYESNAQLSASFQALR